MTDERNLDMDDVVGIGEIRHYGNCHLVFSSRGDYGWVEVYPDSSKGEGHPLVSILESQEAAVYKLLCESEPEEARKIIERVLATRSIGAIEVGRRSVGDVDVVLMRMTGLGYIDVTNKDHETIAQIFEGSAEFNALSGDGNVPVEDLKAVIRKGKDGESLLENLDLE